MKVGHMYLYLIEERLRPEMTHEYPEYVGYTKWRLNHDCNGNAVEFSSSTANSRVERLRLLYPQFEFRIRRYKKNCLLP